MAAINADGRGGGHMLPPPESPPKTDVCIDAPYGFLHRTGLIDSGPVRVEELLDVVLDLTTVT
jgi:hypothetical protein